MLGLPPSGLCSPQPLSCWASYPCAISRAQGLPTPAPHSLLGIQEVLTGHRPLRFLALGECGQAGKPFPRGSAGVYQTTTHPPHTDYLAPGLGHRSAQLTGPGSIGLGGESHGRLGHCFSPDGSWQPLNLLSPVGMGVLEPTYTRAVLPNLGPRAGSSPRA